MTAYGAGAAAPARQLRSGLAQPPKIWKASAAPPIWAAFWKKRLPSSASSETLAMVLTVMPRGQMR